MGALGAALDLWDRFREGGGLDQSRLAYKEAQAQAEQNTKTRPLDLQIKQNEADTGQYNIATAKALSEQHAALASAATRDESTKKGLIDGFAVTPATLMKPTTQFSPDEEQQWRNIYAQSGVKDLNAAAKAHNEAVLNFKGRAQPLADGFVTGATMGPGGTTVSVSPKSLPLLDSDRDILFGPPGASPAPAASDSGTPAPWHPPMLPPAAPNVAAPQTGAQSPAGKTALGSIPDFNTLLKLSPLGREAVSGAAKAQNELLDTQQKTAALEKSGYEHNFGPPEERKAESEFVRNSAQLSHRLQELEDVVNKYGNYEYWNGEGAAKLSSLPLDISDNWTKITNPGGVLREGLVHLGKTEQIPIPGSIWTAGGTKNATTLAAIDQTRNVLADYVRQYENLETTHLPVTGLSPDVEKLVGQTRLRGPEGKVLSSKSAEKEPADAVGVPPKFSSQEAFNASGADAGYVPSGGAWKLVRKQALPVVQPQDVRSQVRSWLNPPASQPTFQPAFPALRQPYSLQPVR